MEDTYIWTVAFRLIFVLGPSSQKNYFFVSGHSTKMWVRLSSEWWTHTGQFATAGLAPACYNHPATSILLQPSCYNHLATTILLQSANRMLPRFIQIPMHSSYNNSKTYIAIFQEFLLPQYQPFFYMR